MTAPAMDINGGGADLTAKYQVLSSGNLNHQNMALLTWLSSLTEACHWVRKTASPVSGAEKGSSGRTREEPRSSRSGFRLSIIISMFATLNVELWLQRLLRSIRERRHYEKEKERWRQCSSGLNILKVKTFSVPLTFQEPTAGQEGQSIAGGSRGSSKG